MTQVMARLTIPQFGAVFSDCYSGKVGLLRNPGRGVFRQQQGTHLAGFPPIRVSHAPLAEIMLACLGYSPGGNPVPHAKVRSGQFLQVHYASKPPHFKVLVTVVTKNTPDARDNVFAHREVHRPRTPPKSFKVIDQLRRDDKLLTPRPGEFARPPKKERKPPLGLPRFIDAPRLIPRIKDVFSRPKAERFRRGGPGKIGHYSTPRQMVGNRQPRIALGGMSRTKWAEKIVGVVSDIPATEAIISRAVIAAFTNVITGGLGRFASGGNGGAARMVYHHRSPAHCNPEARVTRGDKITFRAAMSTMGAPRRKYGIAGLMAGAAAAKSNDQ